MEITKNDEKIEHDLETITKTYLFYLSEEIIVDAVEMYHENRHHRVPIYLEKERPYATLELANEKKENLLKEYFSIGFKLERDYSTKDSKDFNCADKLKLWCSKLVDLNHEVYLEIQAKEINPDDVAINKKGESFYDGQKIIFSLDK
jgi:hypothetical protein